MLFHRKYPAGPTAKYAIFKPFASKEAIFFIILNKKIVFIVPSRKQDVKWIFNSSFLCEVVPSIFLREKSTIRRHACEAGHPFDRIF